MNVHKFATLELFVGWLIGGRLRMPSEILLQFPANFILVAPQSFAISSDLIQGQTRET
jgi:hypothetical protein